jgi:UDP-glucuronate 4-epimerase
MRDLIAAQKEVIGVDSFSPYYSPLIKKLHLEYAGIQNFVHQVDISELEHLREIYRTYNPSVVIHLAAQGGVRASQLEPEPYILSNQLGFLNLLTLNNEFGVGKFIYASSSSVYGDGLTPPFQEDMKLPAPKSLYALSKLSNELMAEHFPNVQNAKRLGLRFFTVYGPWGRPDMAVSRMLVSGLREKPFNLTASLNLSRDFTYVDDVSLAIIDLIKLSNEKFQPHQVFNVAGESPRSMFELIEICHTQGLEIQISDGIISGLDVEITHGSSLKLNLLGVRTPSISLEAGIKKTLSWMNLKSMSNVLKLLD